MKSLPNNILQHRAFIIFSTLKICGRLLKYIPYPLTLVPAGLIGFLFIMFCPHRIKIAFQNIHIIFPQKSFFWKIKIILLAIINHALSLWEFLWSPALTPDEIVKRIVLLHDDFRLLKNGGIIIVLVHSGCWEPAIQGLGRLFPNTVYVYRKLHSKLAESLIKFFRESHRTKAIMSKGAISQSEILLENSQNVYFAIDHHFKSSEGVQIRFFNKEVSAPPGPAVLQDKTGRQVLIAGFFRDWKSGKYNVYIKNILQPNEMSVAESKDRFRSMTQVYFKHIEPLITLQPEQYWWFHRIFKKTYTY